MIDFYNEYYVFIQLIIALCMAVGFWSYKGLTRVITLLAAVAWTTIAFYESIKILGLV